jgi:selenocysteine lyase/cysteine desulfurase
VAKFFGVEEKEIIFTSGATESLNLVIHNLSNKLKKGDEVVISYGEHSSNLIP